MFSACLNRSLPNMADNKQVEPVLHVACMSLEFGVPLIDITMQFSSVYYTLML